MLPLLLIPAALALTPETAQEIFQIESLRLPPAALESFVASPDAETRARAARALGRLRTRAAVGSLLKLSRDPSAEVRAEAAFALGQTPETGEGLRAWLFDERDPTVRAAIVEGLGKQGAQDAIPTLLSSLASTPPLLRRPEEAEAAAVALGRLAARNVTGIKDPTVTGALLRALDRVDRDLRRGAAFALARIAATELPEDQRAVVLRRAAEDPDPVVRAFLVRASAPLTMPAPARAALYARTAKDNDAGVRVATARAAGSAGWEGVTALLADPELGVRLETITSLGKIDGIDHAALLFPILDAGITLEAAEAARTHGDAREALAVAAVGALAARELLPTAGPRSLMDLLEPARPTRIRAAAATALTDRDRLVALAVNDGEAAVRTAAVSQLLELGPRPEQALALFESFDAMVVAVAGEWLSEHPQPEAEARLVDALATAKDDQLDLLTLTMKALEALYDGSKPLVRAPSTELGPVVERLLAHPDVHVHEEATKLARTLGLSPPPYQHRLYGVNLAEVAKIRSARILTTRGEVIVDLDPEDAPLTVWNWASLAEKGWFNGLVFHRVVPDFVVQDGDPRGDGWGGPGWSIPDEIAPGHYREGTLGMALSGPDTGGSQWFVTLSPQPHLDGTYTIFGEVTSGMQVFRAIQPGDRILSVTIER